MVLTPLPLLNTIVVVECAVSEAMTKSELLLTTVPVSFAEDNQPVINVDPPGNSNVVGAGASVVVSKIFVA